MPDQCAVDRCIGRNVTSVRCYLCFVSLFERLVLSCRVFRVSSDGDSTTILYSLSARPPRNAQAAPSLAEVFRMARPMRTESYTGQLTCIIANQGSGSLSRGGESLVTTLFAPGPSNVWQPFLRHTALSLTATTPWMTKHNKVLCMLPRRPFEVSALGLPGHLRARGRAGLAICSESVHPHTITCFVDTNSGPWCAAS